MTLRVFIGIDCGTQSTKALVLEAETGAVLSIGRSPHTIIEAADGTREQDPAWWIKAILESVRGSLDAVGAVEIAGLAVSGQQHGLVVLDSAHQPLRPAKLWNDTTTVLDCEALTERLGGEAAVLSLTGNLFLPGYTAPKVSWLRRKEPELYARARHFCLPHDYLNLWLTGEFCSEPGDASGTAYFDVRKRGYSETVLTTLDADRDWEQCLPGISPSLSLIGGLRREAAESLGLPRGIPVSAGGGDNMCAAIGAGAVVTGPVIVSLGTSGTVFSFTAGPAIDPKGEAAAFCSSTDGWLPLACTLNCTSATEWVMGLLGLDRSEFEARLQSSMPGAAGLTFIPYLNGERTPNRPAGFGILSGLQSFHTSTELVRAVVEGLTFGLAYAMRALSRAGIEPGAVTLVGGGAASEAWSQIVADVFRLPVHRPALTEAAALGAALQVRHVVSGNALPTLASGVESWEPRVTPELIASAARFEMLQEKSAQAWPE